MLFGLKVRIGQDISRKDVCLDILQIKITIKRLVIFKEGVNRSVGIIFAHISRQCLDIVCGKRALVDVVVCLGSSVWIELCIFKTSANLVDRLASLEDEFAGVVLPEVICACGCRCEHFCGVVSVQDLSCLVKIVVIGFEYAVSERLDVRFLEKVNRVGCFLTFSDKRDRVHILLCQILGCAESLVVGFALYHT